MKLASEIIYWITPPFWFTYRDAQNCLVVASVENKLLICAKIFSVNGF